MRRRDWWLRYVLVIALIGVVTTWIDARWFPDAHLRLERGEGFDVLWPFADSGGPVTALAALVLLVPNVAAMVTRLHDRDHSAWWLLWNLVPGIGWLVLVVTVGLLGSQPRPNRYGPRPT
ncbi:hypothetical protein DQ237_17975 [Blastococcus sp. TF02-8]|uniref:DUF805 domain-containing protein n=1 Tax=Blastococcus sp. TF02-8 TaxID=2250574 RepID=UPI000DEAF0D3|nr:DUF805 domain-containing protein [Blastococcus sp. TF02-8]RBY93492.1 hypothetical protein DQ237_17975 [Blastococcus sp. TF02-8]